MDNKAAGGYIHLYGFSLDWVDVDIRFKESLRVIRYCLYFGLGYYKSVDPPTATIPSYCVMDGVHLYIFTLHAPIKRSSQITVRAGG